MVELLIELEEALSKLFEAYAEKFSSLEPFWRGLSADELIHADWIRELLSRAEEGTVLLNENRFATEAVRTSLHHTIHELVAARIDDVSLIEALSRAMSAEESLLEKKYFEVFEGDSVELKQVFKKLAEATRAHMAAVRRFWEKYRNL